ncbi:MAG: pantetheine-phosphate adenylyltransferase [Myxococcales bacterium]
MNAPNVAHAVIYPGSFDPLTNGHLSLIHRALSMFDRLVVAVAHNPKKQPLFSVEERKTLIREAINNDPRVEIDSFEGLLVNYARSRKVKLILRGLRAVSDFEYEFQMANMNRTLDSEIETVFVMTGEDYFYVSSQIVREVAALGGDVSSLVPPNVLAKLKERFAKP